jgi:hypothetical protein
MRIQELISKSGKFYVSNGSKAVWSNGIDTIGGTFQSQKAQVITKATLYSVPLGQFWSHENKKRDTGQD